MINFFSTKIYLLYSYAVRFYLILAKVADWHIWIVDTVVEKIKNAVKPVFAPVEHLYKDNEPLQRYFWYLFFATVLSLSLSCWPIFLYLFITFELMALVFSAVFDHHSHIVRRGIVLFFLWLWSMDAYFFMDPLTLLEDILEFLGLDGGNWLTSTYFILLDLIDEFWFWLYYFAVFYAPYLGLTLALFSPLISFLYAFLFGFLLGYQLIGYVASFFIFVSFVSATYILLIYPAIRQDFLNLSDAAFDNPYSLFNIENIYHNVEFELFEFLKLSKSMSVQMDYGTFVETNFVNSNLEFSIDSVSSIFIFVITFISFLVHAYSIVYMRNDPHTVRFFGLLSFFTFSMLILVSTSDLLILFIGWEGVGLSSFLLISFWYTRVPALKSGLKAILMNKIGDIFLLFAISLICYYAQGDMSIYLSGDNILNQLSDETPLTFYGLSLVDLTALLITLAAFVKSAQLFFHTWLPDAMEGPTPVSALLHAATMVTAGVYLIIRFSFLIEFSYISRILMLVVSVWTLIITSLIALFQYDIKKIIAYSTCGQLAIMFLACSLSGYDFALYHFFNHAFFKCLLFLLAGMIIHELNNEQDIRAMGTLSAIMPYTFFAFTLAMLSSLGFPFFSGAASKDLIIGLVDSKIIEAFFDFFSLKLNSIFYVMYFTKVRFALVVLTSLYMLRLYYYVFFCFPNFRNRALKRPDYVDPFLRYGIYTWVVSILVLFSLLSGKVFKNFFIFTECNYVNIHNDITIMHANTLFIAYNNVFAFITHFTLALILAAAAYLFRWKNKNSHVSFFSLRYDYFFSYRASFTMQYHLYECWDEFEWREKQVFMEYIWRPISWPMEIYYFFNKRCLFDFMYNYYLVSSTLLTSVYLRIAFERGIFLFLADHVIAFSKRVFSMSGYSFPKGFLVNFFFIVSVFVVLWFLIPS